MFFIEKAVGHRDSGFTMSGNGCLRHFPLCLVPLPPPPGTTIFYFCCFYLPDSSTPPQPTEIGSLGLVWVVILEHWWNWASTTRFYAPSVHLYLFSYPFLLYRFFRRISFEKVYLLWVFWILLTFKLQSVNTATSSDHGLTTVCVLRAFRLIFANDNKSVLLNSWEGCKGGLKVHQQTPVFILPRH